MSSFEEIMVDFDSSAFEPEIDAEFKNIIDLAQSKSSLYERGTPIDIEQIRADVKDLNARWQAYRVQHNQELTVSGFVHLGVEYIEYADSFDDELVTFCADDDPMTLVDYPVSVSGFAAGTPRDEAGSSYRIVFIASVDIADEDGESSLRCAIDLDTLDLPLESADHQLITSGVDEYFQNHFNFVQYSVNSAADVCEATIHLKDAVLLPVCEDQELEEYRQYLNEYLSQVKYNEFIPYIVEVCGAYEESDYNNTTYVDRDFEETTSILLSQPILTAGFDDGVSRIFLKGMRLLEGKTTTIRIPLGSLQDIRDTSDFYRDFLKK